MNELSDAQCPFVLYHWGKEVQEMKYLKIFTDFLDEVEPLDDEECGRLFKAMLGYSLDGREPQLTGNERFLWVVARQHMDREAEVYEKKVKHLKRGNVPVTEKKGSVSEQDKDKDKEKDKDKDKDKDSLSLGGAGAPEEREKRPTLSEVMEFSQREGIQTDVEYFFNYYEANGWHMGKQPIRDWRAALKAWALKTPTLRPAPARKPDFLDNFRGAMELLNMEEAKQV